MSKQKTDMNTDKVGKMKKTSHQMKEQFVTFIKSLKRKEQTTGLKNKLNQTTEHSSHLRFVSRVTTAMSGIVIVGLSIGLLYMAQPIVTAETFEGTMEDSINAAFAYKGNNINIKNSTLSYHIPRQFQYKWSIGVNDILKYKDNEVIMNYNPQYNAVDMNNETYNLLRDENKAAGNEVFYKNFEIDGQSGFVQLVQLPEKYLLMVLVDGTKLSAIIDYQEAPYLTYNMLVLGRTAIADEAGVAKELRVEENEQKQGESPTQARAVEVNTSDQEEGNASNQETENNFSQTSSTLITNEDQEAPVAGDSSQSSVEEGSSESKEQLIQFDFSSEKRNEAENN